MKNTKARFASLGQALVDQSSESPADTPKLEDVTVAVKTAPQKAVKSASQPARSEMQLAKPLSAPAPARHDARTRGEAEEEGGEPRRQMTVKLPLSLYARLSEEKSRRVVTNNKSWSIQDIITEALERHLRAH